MALVLILPVPFFVILWAIDNSPHSIFTFSRRRNRRNDQQPLILPKVCFTSTTLCERSSIPFSEQRFSFAFFFNSFNRCENCMVFGFLYAPNIAHSGTENSPYLYHKVSVPVNMGSHGSFVSFPNGTYYISHNCPVSPLDAAGEGSVFWCLWDWGG